MPTREASAIWNGDLKNGNGHMSFGSGAYDGVYSFASRFENGAGTNPDIYQTRSVHELVCLWKISKAASRSLKLSWKQRQKFRRLK